MRTRIEIDDDLMQEVIRLTGAKTKSEAVELGLRTLLRLRRQETIRHFKGKLQWKGNLEVIRSEKSLSD